MYVTTVFLGASGQMYVVIGERIQEREYRRGNTGEGIQEKDYGRKNIYS